jgi:hypothetical protein
MSDLKNINGHFRRVYRDKAGMYGIQYVTIEKGKVTAIEDEEPNYPTVTLRKFGKTSFEDAQKQFDKDSQMALFK